MEENRFFGYGGHASPKRWQLHFRLFDGIPIPQALDGDVLRFLFSYMVYTKRGVGKSRFSAQDLSLRPAFWAAMRSKCRVCTRCFDCNYTNPYKVYRKKPMFSRWWVFPNGGFSAIIKLWIFMPHPGTYALRRKPRKETVSR